jgi:signal peptidase I
VEEWRQTAAAPPLDTATPLAQAPAERTIVFRAPSAWAANLRWLLSVLLIVFFIRTFVGEATIIPTGSMENTILVGDHVFLDKLFYGPEVPFIGARLPALREVRRQQIIAFRFPGDPSMIYVKRVIGLPGDRIEIRRNLVFVNGLPLREPYAYFSTQSLRENFGPISIPADHYFVMGDNRDNSYDSRFWGPVPGSNIVGEPLLVYWSYDAPSDAWLREGLMNKARFYASVAAHFFSKTRWSRTGLVF